MRRLVAFLLVLAACGNGASPSPATVSAGGESSPVAPLRDAAVALCTARDQARGDVKAARTTFYDRSHDALHTLARLLGETDRALAARLLENKNRVESDFGSDPPSDDVAGDLERLADVTRSGLASLSVDVPACS